MKTQNFGKLLLSAGAVIIAVIATYSWLSQDEKPYKRQVATPQTIQSERDDSKMESENSSSEFPTNESERATEVQSGPSAPKYQNGDVIERFGTLVAAERIAINCRDERVVIRPNPIEDDYKRVCDEEIRYDHPYAQFTMQQLAQIADSDATAAYLLATRILQPDKRRVLPPEQLELGLSHALRALVISNDPQAFELLIDGRNFPNRGVWMAANPDPTEQEIREKVEELKWYKVGLELGYISASSPQWKRLLRQVQRAGTRIDMDAVSAEATQMAETIRDQQLIANGGAA